MAGVAGPWVLNGGMAYYNGGNVGIGTSTPDLPLSVTGEIGSIGPNGGNFTARNPNNQTAGVSLGWFNDVARLRISGGGAGALGGLDIQRLGNQSLMRLLDNGNVGIGTSSPVHKLHVEGPAVTSAIYGHTTYNGSDRAGVHGLADAPNFGTGVLGVSSAPQGTGVLGFAPNSGGVNYGVVGNSASANGYDFFAAGIGINYGASSSRRWKSNIKNIDRPLDKIARIRGVYYDWDAAHGGHHDIGMIAEEVGEVLPEIVAFEKNGVDAVGLDYSKLSPLLVEAINALRAEKDAEISDLKHRVETLERLLGALVEP